MSKHSQRLVQDSAVEYVCFDCIVPDGCDEGDDRCLYQKALAEAAKQTEEPKLRQRRKRKPYYYPRVTEAQKEANRLARYDQGKRCPRCDRPITNAATTCSKHKPRR